MNSLNLPLSFKGQDRIESFGEFGCMKNSEKKIFSGKFFRNMIKKQSVGMSKTTQGLLNSQLAKKNLIL